MKKSEKVVILGAGIAGLSAAWKLSKLGFDVEIVEIENRSGGLCKSLNVDGFILDYGPHAFHNEITYVVKEIKSLLNDRLLSKSFNSQVYFMDKFLTHPLTIRDIFLGIGPILSTKALLNFIFARSKNIIWPTADKTFEDWVINRFGRLLYDVYFGPYTHKVWGVHPSGLASTFASKRIPATNLFDTIIKTIFGKAIKLKSDKHSHSPYGRIFNYPKEGIGEIVDVFVKGITENEGKIHLETQAKKVITKGKSVDSVIFSNKSGQFSIKPDFLLSSIPITDLVNLFSPQVGKDEKRAAENLRFRSLILLYLLIDKDRISPNHWIYFSDKDLLFNRICEMKNFSEFTCPEGKTSLCIEISCDEFDSIWNMPTDKLFEQCFISLQRIGLLKSKEVIKYFTIKVKHGYPIYKLGYEDSLKCLLDSLNQFNNLVTFGRQGLFAYTNVDHSIDMGFQVAEFLQNRNLAKSVTFNSLFNKYKLSY